LHLLVVAERLAQVMHDDFGVVVTDDVVIGFLKQRVAQVGVVGKLPVEREAEPFPLAAMLALKRLGETAFRTAAGGVAHMTNGGRTGVVLHQRLVFFLVAQAKGFDDRADLAVGVHQLAALWIEGGYSRRQLATVLQIQEHSRDQPRNLVRPRNGSQAGWFVAGQVIDGCNPAVVSGFVTGINASHRLVP